MQDFFYAYLGKQTVKDPGKISVRPLLHSKSLEFIHPITGERMYLECGLPVDFKEKIGMNYV